MSDTCVNNQMNSLLDNIGIGVFSVLLDDGYTLRFGNDSFYSIIGYTKESFNARLGNKCKAFVHPDSRPAARELIRNAIASGKGNEKLIFKVIRGDGETRHTQVSVSFSADNDGSAVMDCVMADITDAIKAEAEYKELRANEKLLRMAAAQGNRVIARYDIKNKIYFCEEDSIMAKLGLGKEIPDMPQAAINAGIVADESRQDSYDFFENLNRGKECSVSLLLATENGNYRWFFSEAKIQTNDEGEPWQAVIVYNDVTEQRKKEAVYKKWQQSLADRAPSSYMLYRCNISRNAADDRSEGELFFINFSPQTNTFNGRTMEYAKLCVYTEDRDRYTSFVTSESLLAKYYAGEHSISIEYREKLPNGNLRWLRLTVEMVQYTNTADIEAFLMFEDIDEEKNAQLLALERAEADPLTGALNRIAFASKFDKIIGKSHDGTQHALMMLDIDGFKLLNDTLGHNAGDHVLVETANAVRSVLRPDDLLCRYGGDEFLICIRDIPYNAAIEKKADQICSQLRKSYSLEVQISASIGIAIYPQDGNDFETLFRHADSSLYNVKSNGKDGFAFYSLNNTAADDKAKEASSTPMKKRMLIVDDNKMNCQLMAGIFKDDFTTDIVNDGRMALIRMRRYGHGISVVLLDISMPGMDGFTVLEKMRESAEMRSIPVIVVSGADDPESSFKAIRHGASDFVPKPIDPHLIRLRVQSAISKSENEHLRAQNSYLQLQSGEEAKYRTVIESTGTILIEYDWVNSVFVYDATSSKYLAGNFDGRKLWRIMLSDRIADSMDVKDMQEFVHTIANDRTSTQSSMRVKLRTAGGERHWFRFTVFKKQDEYGLTEKLLLTFNDINAEVLSEERLRYQAERDSLTGLYNRDTFFALAAKVIAGAAPGRFVLSAFDIDNFKVYNDLYGSEMGDAVLIHIGQEIRNIVSKVGGICARIGADNFAAIYPSSARELSVLDAKNKSPISIDDSTMPLAMSTGRCVIYDTSMPVSAIYDRAFLAKQSIKGRYDERTAYFDESMREDLLHAQEIVNDMNAALKNKQFEVWFQPQYNHDTKALIGAEALVRWRHPKKGLVPPGDFIGVFERNGFIYEVDKFVWERTCSLLRKWIDEGRNPMPVSVNISRYDIFRSDLIEVIAGLVRKYSIPVELLRLEITESAFAKSAEQIIAVVEKLIARGFTVEIDDFGSGYSSLNTLKNVPAQIIKLDMRFIEDTDSSTRGGNILESVIRMAKWLGMPVIAEGVETIEQADFLKSIGCVYIQGYLYSKPLPLADYEALGRQADKEERLISIEKEENLDTNAFWNPKSIETLIFNSYIGGACIYEWHNGAIDIIRANDKFSRTFESSELTSSDALAFDWAAHFDEESLERHSRLIEEASKSKEEFSDEFVLVNLPGCPARTYVRTTQRVLAITGDRYLVYCMLVNITAQREAERQHYETAERLRLIMEKVNCGITATTTKDDGSIDFIFANDRFYSMLGYTKQQWDAEVSGPYSIVHPDDMPLLRDKILAVVTNKSEDVYEYRCFKRNGEIIYLRGNISSTKMAGIEKEILLSVTLDVSKLALARQKADTISEQLRIVMDNINGGVTATVVSGDSVHYFYANDNYYQQLGYTKEQFEAEVQTPFMLVHPDDRENVMALANQSTKDRKPHSCAYRAIKRDGTIVWLLSNVSIVELPGIEHPVQLAVANDITEQRKADERDDILFKEMLPAAMSHIMESASDASFVKDTDLKYVCSSRAFARITGFDDEKQIVGKTDYDLICKELADKFRAEDLELIRSKQPLLSSKDILPATNDDDTRYICTSKYPLLGKSGRVIGIYGIGRDTTEEREAFIRLQLLADNLDGGFATYEYSPKHGLRTLYISDGALRMTGYTKEEHEKIVLKEGPLSLVFEADRPLVHKQLNQLAKDGTSINGTYRIRACDGSTRWINLRGANTGRQGESVRISALLFDVTDITTAEQERHADEERNRIIAESLSTLIYDYDYATDTMTYRMNRQGTGFSTIVIKRHLEKIKNNESNVIHPDSVQSYCQAFADAAAMPAATGSIKFKANGWGTGYRNYTAHYVSVADTSGSVSRIVGFTIDDNTQEGTE